MYQIADGGIPSYKGPSSANSALGISAKADLVLPSFSVVGKNAIDSRLLALASQTPLACVKKALLRLLPTRAHTQTAGDLRETLKSGTHMPQDSRVLSLSAGL